jgi:hypothetical protein
MAIPPVSVVRTSNALSGAQTVDQESKFYAKRIRKPLCKLSPPKDAKDAKDAKEQENPGLRARTADAGMGEGPITSP